MLQRLLNRLADTGRFVGGMLYWNARKSAYVWRGRRGQCPCQNESDDSIAGRVRCDAILHWHNPARFQPICPLLAHTAQGWRCSVHAAQVRPYWGRVFRWIGLALVGAYLAGTVAVWAGLRAVGGAPVGWLQVAWPGQWREIKPVQSAHLFRQAMDSFAQGRLPEAHLKLTTARALDPANYDVALLLAQISMFQRSYLFSDDLFMDLWRKYPATRLRTAIVYHDTLLSLDRMEKLAEFTVMMASTDPGRAVVWVRSALLAARSMRAEEAARFREKQSATLVLLAPHAQLLLAAELDLRAGDESTALAAFRRKFAGPFNPFYAHYQIERLAGVGATGDAQALLDAQGQQLGEVERLMAQTTVSQLTGDRVLALASFRILLRQSLNAERVERLATFLIMHPDAGFFRELHDRVQREPPLEGTVDGATMWITGVACGAPVEAEFWQKHGRQPSSAKYPQVTKLDFTSRNLLAPGSVCHLINVVPLSRDVILALLGRVAPQEAMVGRKAGPGRR